MQSHAGISYACDCMARFLICFFPAASCFTTSATFHVERESPPSIGSCRGSHPMSNHRIVSSRSRPTIASSSPRVVTSFRHVFVVESSSSNPSRHRHFVVVRTIARQIDHTSNPSRRIRRRVVVAVQLIVTLSSSSSSSHHHVSKSTTTEGERESASDHRCNNKP